MIIPINPLRLPQQFTKQWMIEINHRNQNPASLIAGIPDVNRQMPFRHFSFKRVVTQSLIVRPRRTELLRSTLQGPNQTAYFRNGVPKSNAIVEAKESSGGTFGSYNPFEGLSELETSVPSHGCLQTVESGEIEYFSSLESSDLYRDDEDDRCVWD